MVLIMRYTSTLTNQNIPEQVAYVLQDNYWGSRRLPVKNLYNEGAIDASKDVAVIDPQ